MVEDTTVRVILVVILAGLIAYVFYRMSREYDHFDNLSS